jgi:hypothetical protein
MSLRVTIKATWATAESITETVEVSNEIIWSVVTCLISLDLLTSGAPEYDSSAAGMARSTADIDSTAPLTLSGLLSWYHSAAIEVARTRTCAPWPGSPIGDGSLTHVLLFSLRLFLWFLLTIMPLR